MDKNKNFSACNIKLDKDNYKGDRTICKDSYNKKKRKNKNKTILIKCQQTKIDNVNENRTLIIGFSNCGKTHLMKFILLRKQEPIQIITKSVN